MQQTLTIRVGIVLTALLVLPHCGGGADWDATDAALLENQLSCAEQANEATADQQTSTHDATGQELAPHAGLEGSSAGCKSYEVAQGFRCLRYELRRVCSRTCDRRGCRVTCSYVRVCVRQVCDAATDPAQSH